jgi:ERCC4-type nuclease
MLRYGVSVIHTDCLASTAKLCQLMASQISAEPTVFMATDPAALNYSSTVSVSKKGNKEDPKNFAACALQGCPGISSAAADAILAAFGTLTAVMAAEEVALAAVQVGKRKLGPAVAKRLYGLLHVTAIC